jgi:hypothetical protein
VQRVLKRALKRRWHHLAEERIEDVSPEIPMGKRFWPVTGAEKKEIQRIFKLPECGTSSRPLKIATRMTRWKSSMLPIG